MPPTTRGCSSGSTPPRRSCWRVNGGRRTCAPQSGTRGCQSPLWRERSAVPKMNCTATSSSKAQCLRRFGPSSRMLWVCCTSRSSCRIRLRPRSFSGRHICAARWPSAARPRRIWHARSVATSGGSVIGWRWTMARSFGVTTRTIRKKEERCAAARNRPTLTGTSVAPRLRSGWRSGPSAPCARSPAPLRNRPGCPPGG